MDLPRVGSKERHSEQIYWAMVDWLAKTDARPGERLPNEMELAERFGVSRPTMREALRVLEYSGLVESRQGRNGGLFAGQGAVPQVIGALRTLFIIGNRSSEDLYEARAVIEVGVARTAALRITDEQLQILEESIELMALNSTVESVRRANTLFHMTLAESVQNEILRAIVQALISLLNEMSPDRPFSQEAVNVRAEGHRAILNAMRAGDPDAAAAAMGRHVQEMSFQRSERKRLAAAEHPEIAPLP